MTKSKLTPVAMTDEIREALDAYCAEHGIRIAELLRNAALREIGREDLIGTMRGRGQPRKSDPADKPRKPKK